MVSGGGGGGGVEGVGVFLRLEVLFLLGKMSIIPISC